jgi:hypothetical protein
VEQAVNDDAGTVRFPAMRLEVLSALESLSDRQYQESTWGRYDPGVTWYDDLTLNIHLLYDDCQVLPDPGSTVGEILLPGDVPGLVELHRALDPLLDELGDRPDAEYLSDPRWQGVVDAARAALEGMRNPPGGGTA